MSDNFVVIDNDSCERSAQTTEDKQRNAEEVNISNSIVNEINVLLVFFAVIGFSYMIHVYFLVTAKKSELAEL